MVVRTITLPIHFAALSDWWHEGTGFLSSPNEIQAHPAYQRIMELGPDAVPLILADLRDRGGFWYPALRALTGVNPVPAEARGKPTLMKKAWLDWGRDRGYSV
ncbi:MAG: hypothetical protein WD557_16465 [Dehalococcoidia bacterium]